MRTAAISAVILCLASAATAQNVDDDSFRFDAGVNIGMSGYLGDANQSSIFSRPGFGGQLDRKSVV